MAASTISKLSRRAIVQLATLLEDARDEVARRSMPRFASGPTDAVIRLPREIRNPELIWLGERVRLGANSVLKATTRFPGSWLSHPEGRHVSQTFTPRIEIGNGVVATASLQVVAFESIVIEDDVMFAANVYVSDGQHGYGSGSVPYKYQGIAGVAPVRIGSGSWIGQNAVIMPGVSIGRQCVIGANSVVTGDIPDGSIAVGAPARVVRRWDGTAEEWSAVAATSGVALQESRR